MADFKTALEALAKGELKLEVLSNQLAKLLEQQPQYATRMLGHLDEMYNKKKIDDHVYAKLKRQINQYRRAHASQTESGGGPGGDSTVFAQEDEDNVVDDATPADGTRVMDESEKSATTTESDTAAFDVTGESDMSSVDIDISGVGQDTSTPTSATGPAGTEWSDPSAALQQAGEEMGPGSIIKQRFKLLDVLGVGGMGKVYKGIDLLKEEARDKNPYVAIKLLNEDFRDHPEAFISLQRESSRQQKLAHPNIATVYDFDRIGGPGTPVYITMELMEGVPLNDYIKKKVRKEGGLPFDEAFDIIRQLGAALSYAHERRLVHSDFKPGNAFLCNDGTVKTLDFGIARAVKNPQTGEAEKTLFDPGKLGALTPAYASLEMLEGEEPDTRDDTYALGCVAFELLTGKHPFNKLPANKAMENKLIPAPVKGLKKKQNKALRKAVAFKREDRYNTVDDFIEDLEAKFIWYKNPWAITAVLVIVIGIGATAPVMNYLHKQEINKITAAIKTGDANTISNQLAAISDLDKGDQLTITTEAKDSIQQYFGNQISSLIDTSSADYNFPEAEKLLDQVALYYPDSSFLINQRELIATRKKQKLSELYSEFSEALTAAKERDDPSLLDNTKDILNTIRLRVDPENPLLTDPRPSNQYRVLADESFNQGNLDRAMTLVTAGLDLAPDDQRLMDLKNRVEKQIQIVSLQEQIGSIQSQLTSLSDYKQHEEDIQKLAELNPGDPLLSSLAIGLQQNIDRELTSILNTGDRADAEALAEEYGGLMSSLELGRLLTRVKLAHLTGTERTEAIQSIVDKDKTAIQELLQEPKLDNDEWKAKLLANVQELDSLAGEDPAIASDLRGIRQSIADLYIERANQTLANNRFDVATELIDSAERFAPGLAEITATRNKVAQARADHERQLRIDGLKKDFIAQVEGNQVVKALEYFNELKTELPPNDTFITSEAPAMLARSYGSLAKSRYEAGDFVNAVKLADEGLKYDPDNSSLQQARREYAVDANIEELTNRFRTALTFNVEDVRTKFGEIETVAPAKYSKFRQDAIKLLEERIRNATDKNAAATLAQNAATIFPGTVLDQLRQELKPEPWDRATEASAALSAGKLTEATAIQQSEAADFTGHPEFVAFSEELAAKKAEALDAYELFQEEKEAAGEDYDQLRDARKLLARAQALWTDNPDYDTAVTELDALIAANKPAPKIIQREEVDIAAVSPAETGTPEDAAKAQKEWKPISSGRECESRLAGYGKRAKAICFDFVNDGWRGPLMVVVPAGGEFNKDFAIS
ncbi:MAG TPA: serine/threonine-protein kinase, partial [Gammaproteobacteria bacterium]|nr:serine/threonine-protein kinase [Gammaproteobacteria bacterium]